jgi:hypothetical protein
VREQLDNAVPRTVDFSVSAFPPEMKCQKFLDATPIRFPLSTYGQDRQGRVEPLAPPCRHACCLNKIPGFDKGGDPTQ